jgi:hypothetical protein
MNLEYHAAVTLPLAGGAYSLTGSGHIVAGVIAGGILIDVDHLIEFWFDEGFSLDVKKFFTYGNSGVNTRFFILFHSFELLFLIGILARWTPFPDFLYGIIIGAIPHILMDYINIVRRFSYRWYSFIIFSFFFRFKHGFDRQAIDTITRLPRNIEVSDGTSSY